MANNVEVTRDDNGIWTVTYSDGESIVLDEVDFMEESAIAAPSNKGKSGMNTLKVHWNIFPGVIEAHWHNPSNNAVFSNFPICHQARYRKNDAHCMPVLATDHVAELTCKKCITAVKKNWAYIKTQKQPA